MNICFLAQQRKSFLLIPYGVFGRRNFIQQNQTEETYHSREGHEIGMCENMSLRMSAPKREKYILNKTAGNIV